MFEMKPEYYIGIDMIDQEHKQLFDYASEAYELLQEEFTPDKYDHIDAIFTEAARLYRKAFLRMKKRIWNPSSTKRFLPRRFSIRNLSTNWMNLLISMRKMKKIRMSRSWIF